MDPATNQEKVKKILQEYFGERPTQLNTSREPHQGVKLVPALCGGQKRGTSP